jgi:hypothetical protein
VLCLGSRPPCVLKTKPAAGDTIGKPGVRTATPTEAPQPQTPEEISNSLYTNLYSCKPKCVVPEACAGTKAKPKAYACRAPVKCDTAVSYSQWRYLPLPCILCASLVCWTVLSCLCAEIVRYCSKQAACSACCLSAVLLMHELLPCSTTPVVAVDEFVESGW